MGVSSVVCKVLEQILFDLSRRELMDETLDNDIANYFETGDAVDRICGKLLPKNSLPLLAPIVVFIQLRAGEAVAAECSTTKMEEQLKAQIVDSDVKWVMPESLSPPSCSDLAPSSSPSDKDEDSEARRCRLEHRCFICRSHTRHGKDEKRS